MIWRKLKHLWQSFTGNSSPANSPQFVDFEVNPTARSQNRPEDQQKSQDQSSAVSLKPDFADLTPPTKVITQKLNEPIAPYSSLPKSNKGLSENNVNISPRSFNQIQELKPLSLHHKQNLLPPRLQPKIERDVSSLPNGVTPPKTIELPPLFSEVKTKIQPSLSSDRLDQIIWRDCEDVYRPTPKSIHTFLQEANINLADSNLTPDNAPVYLQTKAYQNIIKHLKSDLDKEQGGILFGHAYQDPDQGIYVEIMNAIPAPNTLGSKVHLQFTAQTWQGIMDYAQTIYPHENIVGWYHSHPNIGVFMSYTDLKTQETFFYHPWCLSIVYDPVRHEIGFFLGKKAQAIYPVIFSSTVLS
jgi:proteasome lid subunit RPN8/RPN11